MERRKKEDASERPQNSRDEVGNAGAVRPIYICDRCGFEMVEDHCKVVCPNCGARWDCSDLNIYTD